MKQSVAFRLVSLHQGMHSGLKDQVQTEHLETNMIAGKTIGGKEGQIIMIVNLILKWGSNRLIV